MNTIGITLVSIALGTQTIGAENGPPRLAVDVPVLPDVGTTYVDGAFFGTATDRFDAHRTNGTFRLAGNTACNPRVKICED